MGWIVVLLHIICVSSMFGVWICEQEGPFVVWALCFLTAVFTTLAIVALAPSL